MGEGEAKTFKTLDGTAAWEVSAGGWEIAIILVQEAHFGLYYCIMKSPSGKHVVVKRGLNYQGPFFGDLWPKYRLNVIIGLGAAGTTLAAVVIVSLVYTFRFQDGPKERPEGEASEDVDMSTSISPAGDTPIYRIQREFYQESDDFISEQL